VELIGPNRSDKVLDASSRRTEIANGGVLVCASGLVGALLVRDDANDDDDDDEEEEEEENVDRVGKP